MVSEISEGSEISANGDVTENRAPGLEETDFELDSDGEMRTLQEVMDEVEKDMIIKALQLYGSTRRVARILGVSQSTIARKAKKYQQKRGWLEYIED
ncbi:MAG: TyrR/PhhR family helix-turn-helix DNA-binding protein [Carboxydocellales bacterium]